MNILNGFLRGAYDQEATAHIDQKEYSGVATNMYNFIGTKRGALSKRAPFKLRVGVTENAYFVPYIFDQDQRYLMLFEENKETGKANYRLLNYWNGALNFSTVGTEAAVIQPVFTSNVQDNFECSQSSAIGGYEAYQRINTSHPIAQDETSGYWMALKFPKRVILSGLQITNKKVWTKTTVRPGSTIRPGSGFITTYIINSVNFIVEGSNDGQNWVEIKRDTTSSSGITIATSKTTSDLTFSDINEYQYLRVRTTGYVRGNSDSNQFDFGQARFTVLMQDENITIESPFTMQQVKEMRYANENKRMVFFHEDFVPHEMRQTIQPLVTTGLDFTALGNPTFGGFYQERLGMGGYRNANRQYNLSKSNPKDNVNFVYTLPTSTPVSTDAMEIVIRRAKYPLKGVLTGRNVMYLQCIDGLATISSGGDEVPLTPVQISADLRNRTPFSDIPAVYQEELAFLVGSDYKTVYGMDYDFNVMRVRTIPINEHCLSYFESGIAQMITMKGQLPYLVFRLNNGKILAATAYRTNTGFNFHLYPIEPADGEVQCIGTLMNNQTGFDTLFAIIKHSNGVYTLESSESILDPYSEKQGRDYFINNLMLDYQDSITVPNKNDIEFTYTGTISETGRCLFTANKLVRINKYAWDDLEDEQERKGTWFTFIESPVVGTDVYLSRTGNIDGKATSDYDGIAFGMVSTTIVPIGYRLYRDSKNDSYTTTTEKATSEDLDSQEIKLIFNDKEIICKNILFDEQGMWADVSEIPPIATSDGYCIPQDTFMMAEYNHLPVVLFGDDDLIEKKSEDEDGNITFARAVYNARCGLVYKSYAQFENIADASVAAYTKTITNIAASITYGTGIKLGTESTVENVGFADYKFKDWKDIVLADENLRNIPLADTPRKDKKIVVRCDYPFPANITFITYEIKTTGSK